MGIAGDSPSVVSLRPGGGAYLGLDMGTTGVKAAVFSSDGALFGSGLVEYALETPAPDIVELEPEVYWDAARRAIEDALRVGGVAPEAVAAAGITGQAETLICVDAAGRPLRKAIVWLDNRAKDEARRLADAFDPDELFRMSGQTEMLPCWPAAKILWLRENEAEVFARAARFLMVEDYIAHRLTGVYATCRGLMPSSLYYDIRSGGYYAPMLKRLGIGEERLPALRDAGEAIGVCREVLPGAVLGAAPLDHICGNLGAGGAEPGVVSETTGGTLALCAVGDRLVYDGQKRISTYLGAAPGHYALLPWAPTAGMLLKHFRNEFCPGMSFAEIDAMAARIPAGSEGLTVLPHYAGSVSPVVNPCARGVFYGLTLAHGKGHFARALMESVAYLLRDNVETLEAGGVPVREIRALGGGARSRLWLKIKADVLRRPVRVLDCPESTALGAALLGRTAAERSADPVAAAAAMVHVADTMEPGPDAAAYDRCFARYRELDALLLPTFEGNTP